MVCAWLSLDGLFMVLVMIMCLFLGFAIESTGSQMLQEAGVALIIGSASDPASLAVHFGQRTSLNLVR